MRNPYVSVVMPIYNASKFLHQSLGGVINQTLENIEIICVNDGSKDDSLKIIQEYASEDNRIKIINKANNGYGHSMNKGIAIASGEYIAILEPDDFVDENMYKFLYSKAKALDLDVVKSNYFEYSQINGGDTFFEVLEGLPYNTIVSAEENEKILHMRPCIWSAIYKKSFLNKNNIYFTETPGASYQDTAFAFKVWVSAKKVYFVKNAFLHYRIDNENSSVKSTGKIFSICDEFQSIQAYLNQNKQYREKYSKILQVLKLDSYTWNLERISPEFRGIFKDQMALEFIKADYDGFLIRDYFDDERWKRVEKYISDYEQNKYSNGFLKKFKRVFKL